MAERQRLVLQQWSPESLGPIILWDPWMFVQNLIFWQLTYVSFVMSYLPLCSTRWCWWWVFLPLGRASGRGITWSSIQRNSTDCWERRSCSLVWLSVRSPLFTPVIHIQRLWFTPDVKCLTRVNVCIEWWAEGQQAPAGLSRSYWNNQDGCPNSWKLHPRPGNASRSKKKKDLWDVPLWNSLKDSSCYQVVEEKPLLENQPLQAKCQETKVNWFI